MLRYELVLVLGKTVVHTNLIGGIEYSCALQSWLPTVLVMFLFDFPNLDGLHIQYATHL